MNNFLSSGFATSVPFASVIFSILYVVYGNKGLFILSAVCVALPAPGMLEVYYGYVE
jgi:hypothetical protein